MKTPGLVAGGIAATMSLTAVPHAPAQERSLDEIKTEVMRRAGHINPFEGIRRDDAEQVVNALTSLDRDHWAAAWCKVGLAYEAKADARAKAGASRERARRALHACVRISAVSAAIPSPARRARKRPIGIRCACSARRQSTTSRRWQIVEIPFEGKTLVGYLQIAAGVAKPPVVMHWGGVDGWKEDRLARRRASSIAPASPP